MIICHILWGLSYGGIETMVVNIANEQAALGHEVHLIAVNDKIDTPMLGLISDAVSFHCAGRKQGSRNPLPIVRLNRIIHKIKPDAVHLHHLRLYRYILPSLIKHRCSTVHIDFVEYMRPHLAANKNLFAISNHVRDDIRTHTGIDSEVVLNGIDPRKFKQRTTPYSGAGTFRIVQVGRLDTSHKGQHILVEAIAILAAKGLDIQADIIGDGPDRAKIEALIAELGVEKQVRMLGARQPEYIWEHLADYHLLVQPSLFEGFGLTIAEGMAARVPVLVSDVRAQMEVIGEGACGYSFKSADPQSCADAIENIISNYSLAGTVAAYERLLKHYDVRATAANYIEKYRTL
ncbi:MAG: glycosyltransferase family 4 protein [Muribaculaceae bacterium]|nr:glycosyltransferase family 4 protein [Muribaculaceae bacterium]